MTAHVQQIYVHENHGLVNGNQGGVVEDKQFVVVAIAVDGRVDLNVRVGAVVEFEAVEALELRVRHRWQEQVAHDQHLAEVEREVVLVPRVLLRLGAPLARQGDEVSFASHVVVAAHDHEHEHNGHGGRGVDVCVEVGALGAVHVQEVELHDVDGR